MKKQFPAWLLLCVIALVAGGALGVCNALTTDVIKAQALEAAEAARRSVFADADAFSPVLLKEGDPVESCYIAKQYGVPVGFVCTLTTRGYGGPIEVTVGVDRQGSISGISVGGASFSETVGLGARTRDAEFTSQFAGLSAPLVLKQDVDAVTGASISSGAVVDAVNTAAEFALSLGAEAKQ